jgi:nucleotide-binding universal stress UspA family protein
MSRRLIFLSYSRRDSDAAAALAAELDQFGQDVWLDKELSGGQRWWDTILEQIRNSDCFVLAQSRASLESKACMSELEYAYSLGKPLLPVMVGDTPPDGLLKRYLAEAQRVDARDSAKVTHGLARALLSLPDSPPLPEPLPAPPPVPITYMDTLSGKLEQPELSMSEQRNVLADIKAQLAPEREPEAARELLRLMRRRHDLFASVAAEIDALQSSVPVERKPAETPVAPVVQPAAVTSASAPAQTAAEKSPQKRSRFVTGLAIFGALVLALIIIGMLNQPECFTDVFGNVICE